MPGAHAACSCIKCVPPVISDLSAPERNDPLGFRPSGMKPSSEAAAAIALIALPWSSALELFSWKAPKKDKCVLFLLHFF